MYSLAEMDRTTAVQHAQQKDVETARKWKRRLMVLLAVCWAVGASMALHMFNGVASAQATGTSYTVQPGDTAWSIATRFGGKGDPRPMMDAIVTDNHLSASASIYPGEVLTIPRN